MSQGHKSSRLLLKNQIVPIGFDTAYFNYDYDAAGIQYGELIQPSSSSVYTLRAKEGKYGGGVAVEESTTNLPNIADGNWGIIKSNYQGTVTVTTQNNNPYMHTSARFDFQPRTDISGSGWQVAGYTNSANTWATGNTYTWSIYLKRYTNDTINIALADSNGTNYQGNTIACTPPIGQWQRFTSTWTATGPIGGGQFYVTAGETASFELADPQIEKIAFPTSFIVGTRSTGYLEYPKEVLTPQSFTVNAWVKLNVYPSATDQPIFELSNFNTVNNRLVFLIKSTNILRLIVGGTASEINIDTAFTPIANTWYMLSVKFTGTNYYIYINGVLITTFASTLIATPLSSAMMNIGGRYIGVLNGIIDDFIAVPYAITDDEIMAINASGIPVYNPYDRRSYAY